MALLTPWFQTSSSPDYGWICFCCSKQTETLSVCDKVNGKPRKWMQGPAVFALISCYPHSTLPTLALDRSFSWIGHIYFCPGPWHLTFPWIYMYTTFSSWLRSHVIERPSLTPWFSQQSLCLLCLLLVLPACFSSLRGTYWQLVYSCLFSICIFSLPWKSHEGQDLVYCIYDYL